jgi:formiminoglutamase
MSGKSSRTDEWWSVLEPAPPSLFYSRGDSDDPRLGEIVRRWESGRPELGPGQAVLIGFPCDEGVRRNQGRPGAAQAPNAIREFVYRLTPWDPLSQVNLAARVILDLGNVRVDGDLEAAQDRLGIVVAEALRSGAVPIILGGGHETAYGHYLGYVRAGLICAIINIDAHLDVRPYLQGAHSGSPFLQAIEHPTHPLQPGRYVVIGAQLQSVARAHWDFVRQHNHVVHWLDRCSQCVVVVLQQELDRLSRDCPSVLVTIDADAFRQADVPGTSAPSPIGLEGGRWPELAFRAGSHPSVRSVDLVEVNPAFDRDNQTARWAAVSIRQFLIGLATRTV